jgi:hypothetical protein
LADLLAQRSKLLAFNVEAPLPFEETIIGIDARIKAGRIHGLILDLRLDDARAPDGEKVSYRAPLVASHLRSVTAAQRGKVPAIPIVLWSVQSKLKRYLYDDLSSLDLFDAIENKDGISSDVELNREVQLLEALADGYAALNKNVVTGTKDVAQSLCAPPSVKLPIELDRRLAEFLRSKNVQAIASTLLKLVLPYPGILAERRIVAARLGVAPSGYEFDRIASRIERAKYSGPFSNGGQWYWWHAIESWWNSEIDPGGTALLSMEAEDRVERLRRSMRLPKMTAALPIGNGYSSRFTTICQITGKPLDPLDGYVLQSPGDITWQERLYVSREVVLKPAKYQFSIGRLTPTEAERARQLRSA